MLERFSRGFSQNDAVDTACGAKMQEFFARNRNTKEKFPKEIKPSGSAKKIRQRSTGIIVAGTLFGMVLADGFNHDSGKADKKPFPAPTPTQRTK